MKKYKCIIADDEPIAIRIIKAHLAHFDEFEVAAECCNAIETLKHLRESTIDLLFLDIEMPALNGLDMIQSMANPPSVIFTTAHRNYAVEAFDLNAFDYLLKPISFERFAKSINRFLEAESTPKNEPETEKNWLMIKSDKKLHKVSFNKILFIESLSDYVIVHMENTKLITKDRISHIEEKLPGKTFLRVHRGYIINQEKLSAVSGNCIEIGDKKIPIGRNYKENVETKLLAKH